MEKEYHGSVRIKPLSIFKNKGALQRHLRYLSEGFRYFAGCGRYRKLTICSCAKCRKYERRREN